MTSFVNDVRQLFATETTRTMLNGIGIKESNLFPPSPKLEGILEKATSGETIKREDALYLVGVEGNDLAFLILAAGKIREKGKDSTVTFSKNVFVPLTRLCRDNCG